MPVPQVEALGLPAALPTPEVLVPERQERGQQAGLGAASAQALALLGERGRVVPVALERQALVPELALLGQGQFRQPRQTCPPVPSWRARRPIREALDLAYQTYFFVLKINALQKFGIFLFLILLLP